MWTIAGIPKDSPCLFPVQCVYRSIEAAKHDVVVSQKCVVDDRATSSERPFDRAILELDAIENGLVAADVQPIAVDRGCRGNLPANPLLPDHHTCRHLDGVHVTVGRS